MNPYAELAGIILTVVSGTFAGTADLPNRVVVFPIAANVDTNGVAPPPTATPTAAPTPTATQPQYVGTLEEWQMDWLLAATGWPHHLRERAKQIFKCESNWNTHAVGGAGERGIAQIHPIHGIHWERAFDPYYNLTFALHLFYERGSNFSAWAWCAANTTTR